MKPVTLAGMVLIVAGLAGLAYQGITYTSRDTVLAIGPLTATTERQRTIPLPPVAGGVAIVSGLGLVVASGWKRV